ncbi:MAG TPA: tetratricopeptide repeat protein [Bradyrhizobium sp.]|nr:tetratricopeptide repeat protein [Bradyrhizobium sp.]
MLYRFEGCTLDLTRGCLEAAGREVELRPKCFDLLRHLLENGNRLISKEELVAAAWLEVVVTDESLARCISDVRAAIADHEHKIIKTVPRRGYIFTADVTRHEHAEPRQQQSGPEAVTEHVLAERPSIAVLAFTSMSGDPDQEYFSDGITEDIVTELSRFSELLVIARNSSFRYKGQSVDVRQVGRELGARYVLEGSVRRAGDRIRISAQLIDATTGAHRWAEHYDRNLEDTFAVQDEVARTIVAVLAVHVNKAETERALAKRPAVWQAYDHYLRAAHTYALFHSSFSKEDLLQVRRSLDQALAIDPNYARAHALLSRSSISLWVHRWDDVCPWPAAIDGAYQSAREAVRLAPNLSDAHVALCWALSFMRQHEATIAEFDRATELNPNLTDHYFAWALLVTGEPVRAIQTLEAHMRLDPFYLPHVPGMLGFAYYLLGRYAEALPQLQKAVLRAPDHGHTRRYLAATYAQLGQIDKAREEAAEALRIDPWFTIDQAIFPKVCKRPEDGEHFSDGLRKAGFPE